MINFVYVTRESIKYRNPNWDPIPDHSHSKLIIRGTGSEKEQLHFLTS